MARVCPSDRISRMLLHTRVLILSKNLSVEAQDVFSDKLFYVGFYDLKHEKYYHFLCRCFAISSPTSQKADLNESRGALS